MTEASRCWCSNTDLTDFSQDYLRCTHCGSLVVRHMPQRDVSHVTDDSSDLYGRNYYLERHTDQYKYPPLASRVRLDLPERCTHWLRTVLSHRPPPARALELGSGHGGFVALMTWAGYQAQGLELSPWVVDFSRRQFDIEVLEGPIEDQSIDPGSLQVIALMDVLEHLPDPLASMGHCKNLLANDGIFVVQTPHFVETMTYESLVKEDDPFLAQLKPDEHLFLFSQRSVKELFRRIGVHFITFEPAIFSQYDMYFVASAQNLSQNTLTDISQLEFGGDRGKLLRALLDSDDARRRVEGKLTESEKDRSDRLIAVRNLGEQSSQLEASLNARNAEFENLKGHLAISEQDRSERLKVIENQGQKIEILQSRNNELLAELEQLKTAYQASEHDRAERLTVILSQGEQIAPLQARINELSAELEAIQKAYAASEEDRAARLTVIKQISEDRTILQQRIATLQKHRES